MKKILSTLFGIFMLGAVTVSAGWPDEYVGDELPDGCLQIEAEIVEWLDMNAWGMVSPVGVVVIGELCVQSGVATLSFEWMVSRECEETPWGQVGNPENCRYRVGTRLRGPDKVMPFQNGAYVAYVHSPSGVVPYEALTWIEEDGAGRFVSGVFDFVTPLWFYESDEYTRVEWVVQPLRGEVIWPAHRFPKARRGNAAQ